MEKKKQIRLAIVSDAMLPWNIGGKEARYQQIIPRLRDSGLDVTVYTMHWWKAETSSKEITLDGVRYIAICPLLSLYRGDRRSVFQAFVFAVTCLRLMGARMDAIEADQVPLFPLFTLFVISRLRRIPLMVTWHEYWGKAYWVNYLGVMGSVAATLEWLSARTPNVIFAVSPETQQRLRRIGIGESRVVLSENAVDIDGVLAVEPHDAEIDILSVGRLIDHKRVDLTIEALACTPGLCSATLTIVGEGPEKANLERLSRKLGVDGRTNFVGELRTHNEVWSFMKKAKVLSAPSEREGFGLAVAESLVAGTPVVTVSAEHNEARKLIRDRENGSITAPGDPFALGQELDFWLREHPNSNISSEFLAGNEFFGWQKVVDTYIEKLEESGRK